MTTPRTPDYPPEPYPYAVDDESGPILPPWYVRGWTAQNNAAIPAPPFPDEFPEQFPTDQLFTTLSQYYYDGDGNGLGGYLTFWPSSAFTIAENGVSWRIPQRFLGTLTYPDQSSAGLSPWAFSMEGSGKIFIWYGQVVVRLFNGDNPNLTTDNGEPLTYHVIEHIRGGREFDIAVTADLPEFSPIYAQAISGSFAPYQFDYIDPMGYVGADIDSVPCVPSVPSDIDGGYSSSSYSSDVDGGMSLSTYSSTDDGGNS